MNADLKDKKMLNYCFHFSFGSIICMKSDIFFYYVKLISQYFLKNILGQNNLQPTEKSTVIP